MPSIATRSTLFASSTLQNSFVSIAYAEDLTSTSSPSPSSYATDDSDLPYKTVLEVWSLVDKYYIDRTFNGVNWPAVRERIINDKGKDGWVDESGRIVGMLGDRYSRVLSVKEYGRMQKYDLLG